MTRDQADGLQVIKAMHEAIVEAGPDGLVEGHMYAYLMGSLSLDAFNTAIDLLVRAGKVRREYHVLYAIA